MEEPKMEEPESKEHRVSLPTIKKDKNENNSGVLKCEEKNQVCKIQSSFYRKR